MRIKIVSFLSLVFLVSTIAAPAIAGGYDTNLAGNFGGSRSEWSKKGVDVEAVYTFDIMSNIDGGLRRETDFLDNLDVMATFDGEKLYGVKGSTIFLYFLNNDGESFDGDNIGSVQGVDNIEVDSPHTAKLYEAWIEQSFYDDKLSFRLGLYDFNSEFYVTDSSGLFINSTFGIGTEMSQSGENGPSIFPTTSLALRVKWQPDEKSYIMTAVLDGVSGDPIDGHGTHISLGDGDGELYTAEAGHEFDSARLAIGAWYYTSEVADLLTAGITDNNKGYYALAEKEVFDGGTVFLRFGIAEDKVNQTDYAWSTGLFVEHILKNREDSQFGIAVSTAHNSDAFKTANTGVDSTETGFEITYSDTLTPWLTIQPDIQYTINPGTVANVDDSLFVGARFSINF